MKVFKAIAAVVVAGMLFGCAEMKPKEGMSVQDLNHMSALSMHGNLTLVAQQGEYKVYQSMGLGEKPFYIVKYGALVKTVSNGTEVQEYINEQNEMDKLGFANEADYKLGKSIGVDGLELRKLRLYGISAAAEFMQLKAEFESNKSIYGSKATIDSMLQYLQDKATAKRENQTIDQVVKTRKAEEEEARRQSKEEEARQRAEAEAEAAKQRNQVYASRAKLKFTTLVFCTFPYYYENAEVLAVGLTRAASLDNTSAFVGMISSGANAKYCSSERMGSQIKLSKEAIIEAKEVARKGDLIYFVTNFGGMALGFMGR